MEVILIVLGIPVLVFLVLGGIWTVQDSFPRVLKSHSDTVHLVKPSLFTAPVWVHGAKMFANSTMLVWYREDTGEETDWLPSDYAIMAQKKRFAEERAEKLRKERESDSQGGEVGIPPGGEA